MSGYGDCTYGGGTYGDLCGAATPVQHGGRAVRVSGHMEITMDDDEILIVLSS